MNNNHSSADLIEYEKRYGWGSLGYHSWVSKAHKYFYIGTPKVACTKVKSILHQLEGYSIPEHIANIHGRDIDGQPFVSKLTDYSIEEGTHILASPRWFRFCFVRNPYDRLFSAYKSKIMNDNPQYFKFREEIRESFNYPSFKNEQLAKISFKDFVRYIKGIPDKSRDFHWRTQTDVLLFKSINYDFIGRLETFDKDLSSVLRRLNASTKLLNEVPKKVNATDKIYLAAAYDKKIADIAYDIYRSDFDAFDYDRNSWMFS